MSLLFTETSSKPRLSTLLLRVQVAQMKPPLEDQLVGLSERLLQEVSCFKYVIVAPLHWLSIKQRIRLFFLSSKME